jgi:hypothetical protein
VSKQWQSLIFTKHKKIVINEGCHQIIDTLEISHEFWLKYEKSIIECLTKKFKFMTELQINFEINKESFEIITKNSENLRIIQFFGFFGQHNCEKFGQIRGQNLEFIDIYGIEKSELISLLRSTPKLKAIEIYDNFDAVIEQYISQLEEIKINEFSNEWLEKFANLYNNQLKKISFNDWSNEKNMNVVPHFLLFENLESLNFRICENSYYNWTQIISLAQNLKKLKQLEINAYKVSFSFEYLKVFNNLQVFELIFQEFEDQDIKFIEKLSLTKLYLNSCNFLKSESLSKLS